MFKSNNSITAEFKPSKSGIFTLGSLVISAMLMVLGSWFISTNQMLSGLLLFIPGISAGVMSYIHGFKSRKDQDLESGHPIKIVAGKEGYELSADPRTNNELLLNLIAVTAEIMSYRKPLPEASGIVNKGGTIDSSPLKKEEANCYVNEVNRECKEDLSAFEKAINTEQKIDPTIVSNAPHVKLSDK